MKGIKRVYHQGYARTGSFKKDDCLKRVLSLSQTIKLKSRPLILDLGCGDGFFGAELGRVLNAKAVFGLDISAPAVQKAKKRIKARVFDVDQGRLPFKKGYFDLIFCGSLIEVVFNPDHLLKEIRRLLKKNGRLVITFPNLSSWASRLAVLLGYLPYYSRISTQFDLGKWARKMLKQKSTGFIRLYSLSSFKKLTSLYNFQFISVQGAREKNLPPVFAFWDKFFAQIPSLAFKIIVVLKKK